MKEINEDYINDSDNDEEKYDEILYSYTQDLLGKVFRKCIYFDEEHQKVALKWVFLDSIVQNIPNKNEFIMRLNVFIEGLNDFFKTNPRSELSKYDLTDTFLSIDLSDYDGSKYFYSPE